jgi:hypothetical protein
VAKGVLEKVGRDGLHSNLAVKLKTTAIIIIILIIVIIIIITTITITTLDFLSPHIFSQQSCQ